MTTQLKNPTDEMPTNLTFEDWPHPKEFLRGGGMPGVEYLYVLPEEQPRAQQDPSGPWYPVVGMPFFNVRGVHMTMVARGRPIPGARPGSSVCEFKRSKEAIRRVESIVAPPEATVSMAAAAAVASAAKGGQGSLKLPKSLES